MPLVRKKKTVASIKKNSSNGRASTSKKSSSKVVTSYCMKCQDVQTLKPGHMVVLYVSGKKFRKGNCSVCGTNTMAIVSGDTPHDRVQSPAEAKAKAKEKTAAKATRIQEARKISSKKKKSGRRN
jgi:galactose-1-phosphate uridylyltransferase